MSTERFLRRVNIQNYTINDDGSVDVDGDVDLTEYGLTKIPVRFNKVSGSFWIEHNHLKSLEGSPIEVGDDFECGQNELTSLIGSPKSVGGYFSSEYNKITSLEGSPNIVGDYFDCSSNRLTSLKGLPKHVDKHINLDHNQITNIDYIPENHSRNIFFNGNPIGSIFDNINTDFLTAFNTYKVLKGNEINLKRLKYVMSIFDQPIRLTNIKKYYTIV